MGILAFIIGLLPLLLPLLTMLSKVQIKDTVETSVLNVEDEALEARLVDRIHEVWG